MTKKMVKEPKTQASTFTADPLQARVSGRGVRAPTARRGRRCPRIPDASVPRDGPCPQGHLRLSDRTLHLRGRTPKAQPRGGVGQRPATRSESWAAE